MAKTTRSERDATGDTRERLLEAAETLFAERGFAETSLRGLTRAAGTNLAAVHYHFGSKEALLRAVFERRIGPINRERLARLERLRPGGRPDVEDLLEAFLAPALSLLDADAPGESRFLRLVGRLLAEPARHHADWLRDVFRDVESAFVPAFAQVLPHLSPRTLLWRLHFVVGVQCIVMMNPERLRAISDGLCRTDDARETLAQIVAFAAAGLRAPETAPPPERTGIEPCDGEHRREREQEARP